MQPPGPAKSVVTQVLHTKLSWPSACSYAFVFELFYWSRSARRIASHRGVQSHTRSLPSNMLHNFSARPASMVPISSSVLGSLKRGVSNKIVVTARLDYVFCKMMAHSRVSCTCSNLLLIKEKHVW